MDSIKDCPFCGSNKLGISVTSGSKCYYKQVYCKNCHTYGPRIRKAILDMDYMTRFKFEIDALSDNEAVKLWNDRIYNN